MNKKGSLTKYERELEKAIVEGRVKSIPNLARAKKALAQSARLTRKLREARERATPISIRVQDQDLALLRERAAEEGLPYQTVIKSLIHKYVANRR